MPRVLIATDDPNFSLGLVEGYRAIGWDVVVGALNFSIRSAQFDIVHHQWPEELSKWRLPTCSEMDRIADHLQWWKERARCVFTVNNLYPHNYHGDRVFHELYSLFYKHCHVISHYSNESMSLVKHEFPISRAACHVVHSPPSYSTTLARQRHRGSRRVENGIGQDEFVILMLGSLRSQNEVNLMCRAFDLANIPKKRLFMAGKYKVPGSGWRRLARRAGFKLWLRSRNAVVDGRYVDEEDISGFVDSCDVMIVPRLSGLSSAIPLLAMTFGKVVVAPDHGAYFDYFRGSRNLIYETGSARSLARKLEEASRLNLAEVGEENALLAASWSWATTCRRCVEVSLKDISVGK